VSFSVSKTPVPVSKTREFPSLIRLALLIFACTLGHVARADNQPSTGLAWHADDMRMIVGTRVEAGKTFAIQLNDAGQAVVEVDANGAALDDLFLLRLRFEKRPEVTTMVLAWRKISPGARMVNRRFDITPRQTAWFNMGQDPEWRGRARTLGVIFLGSPGEQLALESIELLPPGFPQSWLANLVNWTAFVPWKQFSVNAHTGVEVTRTGFYPVPAVVAVFFLGVFLYLLATVILGNKAHFRWQVVAGLFLCCWLILDLVWQSKLLRQLELTRDTLAGKSTGQKREAGRDATLFHFITRVHNEIGADTSRVFVTSSADYQGMRGAYYLYPRNVFWERGVSSLPEPGYFNEGDYIVVLPPTPIRYHPSGGILQYDQNYRLRAEMIFSDASGGLFRVM